MCKAFCNRKLHGVCMNAPRDWYHQYMEDHFICTDCQNVEKLFKSIYDNIIGHIEHLNLDKDNIISKQHTQSKANEESFKEMARCFDNLTRGVSITRPGRGDNLEEIEKLLQNQAAKDASSRDEMNKNIKSLQGDIDVILQSSSMNTAASLQLSNPLIETLLHRINDIGDELSATRSTLAEVVNAMQPPTSLYNSSLQAELMGTIANMSIDSELVDTIDDLPQSAAHMLTLSQMDPPAADASAIYDVESLAHMPTLSQTDPPTADASEIYDVEPRTTQPAAAPRTLIKHFGTTWTPSEWEDRLKKFRNDNHEDTTSFFIKGAPRNADSSWVCKLFQQKFSINITECQKVSQSRTASSYRFNISSKYEWMFLTAPGHVTKLGNLVITKWTVKHKKNLSQPIKKSSKKSTSNKNRNTNSKSYKSTSRSSDSTGNPTLDPNWKFKTNIFPYFSPQPIQPPHIPTNTLNYTTQSQPIICPSKPITKHPIHQRNRVTFNLSPNTSPPLQSSDSITTLPPDNYPNFIRSHVLNPASSSSSSKPHQTPAFLDPLLPPTVKLTKKLTETNVESRFILSRLRERRIYDNVRIYLAYLHDKSDSICIDGMTKTSVLVSINQEGLPTNPSELRKIFINFHESLNISPTKVENDLTTFASHLSSKRLWHIQKARSNFKNYYCS